MRPWRSPTWLPAHCAAPCLLRCQPALTCGAALRPLASPLCGPLPYRITAVPCSAPVDRALNIHASFLPLSICRSTKHYPEAEPQPNVLVLRIDAPIWFANVEVRRRHSMSCSGGAARLSVRGRCSCKCAQPSTSAAPGTVPAPQSLLFPHLQLNSPALPPASLPNSSVVRQGVCAHQHRAAGQGSSRGRRPRARRGAGPLTCDW